MTSLHKVGKNEPANSLENLKKYKQLIEFLAINSEKKLDLELNQEVSKNKHDELFLFYLEKIFEEIIFLREEIADFK